MVGRYGKGREFDARRYRGLGVHSFGDLHHSATFFDGHWAAHRPKVLDWMHDGCVGKCVYGTCCDQEPGHAYRIATTSGCLRSWFCADVFRESD